MTGNILLRNVYSSDSSFEVQVKGSNFEPRSRYWFNIFYPDGKPIGGAGIVSDDSGDLRLYDGNDTISNGIHSSQRIKTGKYRAAITHIESGISAKLSYIEWKKINQNGIITEFEFDVPYQNESFLILQFPSAVPWGVSQGLMGELEIKEGVSNRKDFLSNKPLIIKCDNRTYHTQTSEIGQIFVLIEANESIESNSKIQAFFDGDRHFRCCKSNELSFEKLKHRTNIVIELLLKKNQKEYELLGGDKILFKGRLIDEDFQKGIPRKNLIITYLNEHYELNSDELDFFYFEKLLPNYSGQLGIEIFFEEDGQYCSSHYTRTIQIKENEKSSLLNSLMEFRLSKIDFKNVQKENEQKSYVNLILTLVNFRVIDLGMKGRDGEQLLGQVGNPAADLVCTDGKVNLIVDCTLDIPNDNKINKIFNSAQYLFQKTGFSFIPIVVTGKQVAKGKDNDFVLILDKLDMDKLYEELFKNRNVIRAREFFFGKLDIEKYKTLRRTND